jgi:hypothetical protein
MVLSPQWNFDELNYGDFTILAGSAMSLAVVRWTAIDV